MKTVILGLGAGGLFTGITLRKLDREREILFIDPKSFDLLHPCGLPYVIEGKIESFEKVKHNLPDMGFAKMLEHEAVSVNLEDKTVQAKDLKSQELKSIGYDELVIATGSRAAIPPIEGAEKLLGRGVFTVDSYDSSFALEEACERSKKAVVLGAGAIGLESANALRTRGLEVTVFKMLPNALAKSLDPDMSRLVEDHLKEKGIGLRFEQKVERITGEDRVEGAVVDGETVEADMVVLAAGVRPNTGFLQDSGIDMGKWGILTDERMQTNVPDVYAVGDCVQVKSLIDGRDWMMQLAVAAYKQGMVAAYNIAGKSRTYDGALSTFASRIGDIEAAATGFNSHSAGDDIVIGKATDFTKPEWCGIGQSITVKLIFEKSSGKLLGAQTAGLEGAAERVNIASTAIQAGMDAEKLSKVELCYCPQVSQTYDVLMQAADNALRKMGR